MSPREGKPATIAQLAEAALDNLWDENKELKHFLRLAEKHRKAARQYVDQGDLESAFVMFAKAATLVLERIPTHRDFHTMLNPAQRNNLSLNGQDMLEKMSEIKPILTERLVQWNENQSEEIDPRRIVIRWADQQGRPGISAEEGERMMKEEMQRWEKTKAETIAAEAETARLIAGDVPAGSRTAALAAAQRAAGMTEEECMKAKQEELRREEDIVRRREKKRQEKAEIAKRQQEADEAAMAVRKTIAANNPGVNVTITPASSLNYSSSAPSSATSEHPPPQPNFTPGYPGGFQTPFREPPRLPIESPLWYEGDSTDSETVNGNRRVGGPQGARLNYPNTPTRAPARSPSYPPPITTTSPGTRIDYPQLMTQHQKRQGYHPSSNSMFNPPLDAARFSSASLYPSHLLATTSHPPSSSAPMGMPRPQPAPPQPLPQPPPQQQARYGPSYPGPSRPAPPVPQAAPPPTSTHTQPTSESLEPGHDRKPPLRQVVLPRDCLPQFLTIAKANTDLNLETCGLLLGRDRGPKFVVTVLLIPKQHATSDTCAMDEEELVMQFTEKRGLITLGWIHTHPSQSCFMSSVDLHTHSGFQCMLPESFAVVCAPKSTPNFGIFRLTDPPGLKTVLDCKAKEAFHPHPDLPIYTDADKGHVLMKDSKLEIVDLR